MITNDERSRDKLAFNAWLRTVSLHMTYDAHMVSCMHMAWRAGRKHELALECARLEAHDASRKAKSTASNIKIP